MALSKLSVYGVLGVSLFLLCIFSISCAGDDDDSGGGSGDDDDDSSPMDDDDDNDDNDDNDNDDNDTTPDDDDDDDNDTTQVIPDAPDELRALGVGSTLVNLSWTDNSSNENGFKIYRQEGASRSFELIATTGPDVPFYYDDQGECETEYGYYVTAYNAAGESGESNQSPATTEYCDVAPPSSLTAVAINETRIDLFWLDNSFNEDNFQIQRRETEGDAWFNLADVEANITTFSDVDAECGTDYDYRIRAYNQNSASPWTGPAASTTAACPPVRPRPVLDSVSPNSYVALSREFLEDPPDPLYPLTIHGDGIAADTMAEVNDFMLPCDTGGEGMNCEADEYGDPEDCATSCVVDMPQDVMKHAGEYVVRLNTPDPVLNGLNTSANTEFFYVVAPQPVIDKIWPRGVMQMLDNLNDPIPQNIDVKVWGRNMLDNVQIRLGPNFGEILSIQTNSITGEQVLNALVSTSGIFPQDEANVLGVSNPPPGGGERLTHFGVNPRIDSWSDVFPTNMRTTRAGGHMPLLWHRIKLPLYREFGSGMVWTGNSERVSIRDVNDSLLMRFNHHATASGIPIPVGGMWIDIQDSSGSGSVAALSYKAGMFNGGDGTFGGEADHTDLPMGNEPIDVILGDLNADGAIDIVTANEESDNISIRFGDGLGGFGESADHLDYPMGNTTKFIALADFNGDGVPDIVSANRLSHNISIRFNDGNGGFGAAETRTDLSMGKFPTSVDVGDINNDGAVDIVTANGGDDTISIRFGDGAGEFGVDAEHEDISMENKLASIAICDLDGDGTQDIITANGSSDNISIRFNDGDGGFGGIEDHFDLPMGDNPRSIKLTDLNNDGAVDVVTVNETNLSIRFGDGAGGFGGPADHLEILMPSGAKFTALGDLNGDGTPDIVTANSTDKIMIRFNDGEGGFGGSNDFTDYAMGDVPYSVAIGDLNNDGTVDIVTANHGSDDISIRFGQGSTEFTSNAEHTDLPMGHAPYNNYPRTVAFGDLNGDNAPDIITSNVANISIRLNNGAGGFGGDADHTDLTMGSLPKAVAIGKLNNDEAPDIVTANQLSDDISIRFNDGTGGFGEDADHTDMEMGDAPVSIAVGELNGDGAQDIVTANLSSDDVSIRFGDGGGGFGEVAEHEDLLMGNGPMSVIIADLDDDGAQDIATLNEYSNDISIRFGDGTGGFGGIDDHTDFPVLENPESFVIGDLNNDGALDIVTTHSDHILSIRYNDGDGGFGGVSTHLDIVMDNAPYCVALNDINLDGVTDIVTANMLGDDISILFVRKNGALGENADYIKLPMGDHPIFVAMADLNDDHTPDFVTANYVSNDISIRLGSIPGTWHQELTDSFSDDPNQPWLPKYATTMTNTEIKVHQAAQTITKVGAAFMIEWTEEPTGNVTLTMHAPDDEADPIVLGTFSEFTAWPDDENPTSWRLNKVFRAYNFQGETGITDFDDWLGLQPTGYWRLEIDNQTNADAEVKNWTVLTDGHF